MKKLFITLGAIVAVGCLTAVVQACCGGPPPPTISAAADPNILWPPNHKMVEIGLNVEVTGEGDWFIVSVASDEPDDAIGAGDGNTTGDIVIGDDGKTLSLRAERCGNKALFDPANNGRIYTIVLAVIGPGGQAFTVEQVSVPHNQVGETTP